MGDPTVFNLSEHNIAREFLSTVIMNSINAHFDRHKDTAMPAKVRVIIRLIKLSDIPISTDELLENWVL